jgi:hypothetical protein
MPRDYITNTEGTRSTYQIILNDSIGLDLYNKHPIKGRFGPAEEGQTLSTREKAIVLDNFVNGMGMAYREIENTYAFGINLYARTPRKVMPGGRLTEIDLTGFGWTADQLSQEIRCMLEWGGNLYLGAGQFILQFTAGTSPPTVVYNMGDDCQIDSALVYNNIPLFSTDRSFSNWQYLTGYDIGAGAWKTAHKTGDPPSTATNPVNFTNPVYLQKMISIFQEIDGIGGNRIFGNDSNLTYTYTQSTAFNTIIGDSTAYATSLAVGDSSYKIQNIIGTNHLPIIVKVDGVYGIESSGIYCPNYTESWRKSVSLLNGLFADFFNGHVLAGTFEGLEQIDISSQQRIDIPIKVSPSYYFANETPIYGVPVAGCQDNGWEAVWLWNGTDSHLCYTRPRENTNATTPNPMVWHGSECTIENQRVTMAFKTNILGYPIMFVGAHDGTAMHLYTLSLPVEGDPYTDFLNGGSHQFAESCKLYVPIQDWSDANAKKIVRRYDLQAEGLAVPELDPITGEEVAIESRGQITVYANADGGSRLFFKDVEPSAPDSEWSLQGIASDNVTGRVTLIPTSVATTGYEIGVLLHGELVDLSANPGVDDPIYKPFALRSLKIRSEVLVEQLEERTYTVLLGYLRSSGYGGRDVGDFRTKMLQLSALQNAGPINFVDEGGVKSIVKLEPGITYDIVPERQGQPWSYILTFSVTFLGSPFFYDIDEAFDSIYAWGP